MALLPEALEYIYVLDSTQTGMSSHRYIPSSGEGIMNRMQTDFWAGRSVLVTGGAGFLGSHVVALLNEAGAKHIVVPRREEYDLTVQKDVQRLLSRTRPDVLLHLAAEVGGIGANMTSPGRFFYANLAMGLHLIEESRRQGVAKYVQVGTVCSYPKHCTVPFRETELWDGYPEETNAPYGIAKKALLVQLGAYRSQYGFNGIYLLPVNLFGPGDNFDLESGHVIPALIRKMVEANESGREQVVLWGTGSASREFLFVEDCAIALLMATERYDEPEPVNLGTGSEITIRELASMIADIVGYGGEIKNDPKRPDGQPRRCLDTSRATASFGFRARTSLRDGLDKTVEWYLANR
jgi:GDP-L-fucose synthase